MSQSARDGRLWQPEYLVAIDPAKCIGCGRCFKVCGRDVMTLKGIGEDGEIVSLDDEEEGHGDERHRRVHRLRRLRQGLPGELPDARAGRSLILRRKVSP
jgi:Nif-specific ferredoxin III